MKKNDLIKSKKRVKDFAEVFTPEKEVKAMVDLVWDKFPKEKNLQQHTSNHLVAQEISL